MSRGKSNEGPKDPFINPPIPPVPPGDPSWGRMDPIGNGTTNGNTGGGANAGTVAGSNPGVAGSTGSLPGAKPSQAAWNDPLLVYRPHGHGFGTGPSRDSGELDYGQRHPNQPWAQHRNTFSVVNGRVEPLSVTRNSSGYATNITAGPAAQRQQSVAKAAGFRSGNRAMPQVFGGFKTSNNPTGAASLPRTQPAPTDSLVNNSITRGISGAARAIANAPLSLFNFMVPQGSSPRSQPTATPSVSSRNPSGVVAGPQFGSASLEPVTRSTPVSTPISSGKLSQIKKAGM